MILAPYTRLHPATARLLNRYAPGHVRVRLDAADPSAYWSLLAKLWREPGDLLIVEQDVGIAGHVAPELTACREPWCGFPYPVGTQVLVCLGCRRFSAELKAAQPDLLGAVGLIDDDAGVPPKHWRRLDVRILDEMRRRGYEQHEHRPAVRHYKRYPAA